jgi:kynurenine formamidase
MTPAAGAANAALPDWLVAAHDDSHGDGHPLGTVASIDGAARRRGLAAVTENRVVSLCRPMTAAAAEHWRVETTAHTNGAYDSVYDRLEISCHGLEVTHLDALNHFGVEGTWYQGAGNAAAPGPSVLDLAAVPIATRAVLLDVAESRPRGWVEIDRPVTSDDLEDALARSKAAPESGDAFVIYMGRDRFENAGGPYRSVAESAHGRPGVAESGARWLCQHRPSLVAWDMLDAHGSGLTLSVHAVSWAIGMLLVDNCALGELATAMAAKFARVGLLIVCPLPIEGTTGSAVNPLVLL